MKAPHKVVESEQDDISKYSRPFLIHTSID